MNQYYILFNPRAGCGRGEAEAAKLKEILKGDSLIFQNITEISSYEDFLEGVEEGARLLIAGGDGTLNRFINDTDGLDIKNDIYYFATGSGNDFLSDIGKKKGDAPVCINRYLKNLPTVTVKGKDYKFLNGIGYGIDGYCCEVGDKLRETSSKPVNYAGIAIKGLLFHFKPLNATVTVDGKAHTYKKVWLAPTMNGRYYGGGMIPTPAQDRLSKDRGVSVMVLFGSGKLKTLTVFPSIFKGEHVRHTEMVNVFTGHEVRVEFDRPCALQIDGETILGVTECSISSGKAESPVADEELSAVKV